MVASSAAGKLRQVIVRNAATVVTDQELWRQLRTAGADDAVWEAAVARWTPAVRQVARRATRDPGTADDLVQEAFTALFRAVRDGQLREVTCARSWLGVVTCHLASRFRKPNRKVSPLDAAADVGAPSHSELAARRVEEADLVHQEIANLTFLSG